MRIAGIVRDSIVDGEGIRDVVFFQGCNHQCEGCHNPDTWKLGGGYQTNVATIIQELSNSSNDVTISGGEPFLQYRDLVRLCRQLSEVGKSIWLYTGRTVNLGNPVYHVLSQYVDVIVDGKFVEKLKDSDLLFRGSSNQRIIDLPKSVDHGEIILWEGN